MRPEHRLQQQSPHRRRILRNLRRPHGRRHRPTSTSRRAEEGPTILTPTSLHPKDVLAPSDRRPTYPLRHEHGYPPSLDTRSLPTSTVRSRAWTGASIKTGNRQPPEAEIRLGFNHEGCKELDESLRPLPARKSRPAHGDRNRIVRATDETFRTYSRRYRRASSSLPRREIYLHSNRPLHAMARGHPHDRRYNRFLRHSPDRRMDREVWIA